MGIGGKLCFFFPAIEDRLMEYLNEPLSIAEIKCLAGVVSFDFLQIDQLIAFSSIPNLAKKGLCRKVSAFEFKIR